MEKGRFPVLFLILLLFFAISVSATPLDPSQQTYVNSGLPDSDRYFPDHRLYLGLFVEPDYYESITLADFNIDAVLPKLTEKDRIYLVIELMESPGAADTNFNVHLIEQAWRDTSATWNSISPALGSSVAQGTLMRGTGTYRIDLTGSLRGLSSFNGIALKTTDSGVYNNKKIRVSLDIVLGANECQLQGGDCKSNCAAGEEEINDGFLGCGFFNPLTKCCKEIEIEQPPEALPPPVINNECRNRGGVGGDEPEEETYGCYIRRPCETLKRPAIDDDGYCNNLYGLPGIRVYCCGPTEAERLAPPSAAPPVPRVAPSLPIREVPPVAVAADACNDSDGGMNIYIKGAVTIPKGTSEDACQIYGQGAFVDVCGENCAIHEEYCKDGVRNATQIRCPNGCKDGACIQAAQPTSTNYIYANGQRIAKIENNQTFYFHNDHLGSATVLSDSDGNFIEEKRYDPFGAELQGTSKIGYNSKELDKDTDLNYYGARYYASEFGRFITADTVKGKLTNPQSLNLYTYTLNNPMKYIDPNGNQGYGVKGAGVYANNFDQSMQPIFKQYPIIHKIASFLGYGSGKDAVRTQSEDIALPGSAFSGGIISKLIGRKTMHMAGQPISKETVKALGKLKSVYESSTTLQLLDQMKQEVGRAGIKKDQATFRKVVGVLNDIEQKHGLNWEWADPGAVQRATDSPTNFASLSVKPNTLVMDVRLIDDLPNLMAEVRHEYGAFLIKQNFGEIRTLDLGFKEMWATHALDDKVWNYMN